MTGSFCEGYVDRGIACQPGGSAIDTPATPMRSEPAAPASEPATSASTAKSRMNVPERPIRLRLRLGPPARSAATYRHTLRCSLTKTRNWWACRGHSPHRVLGLLGLPKTPPGPERRAGVAAPAGPAAEAADYRPERSRRAGPLAAADAKPATAPAGGLRPVQRIEGRPPETDVAWGGVAEVSRRPRGRLALRELSRSAATSIG